ncbi:MAG TPA: RagB/SusD family nutrient uptake outer membrane protein [Puia sp.]|nr:RagB/SusD family nutrient uptake outer membrane protein [Puia sp.]
MYASLKNILPLLIGIGLLSGACKKYIDQAPISSTYSKEFWTSQTSVEQASIAMYGQLRNSLRSSSSFFVNGDLAAGTFLPNSGQWNYASLTATYSPPFNFSYVPYLTQDLQNWSRFYQLIAQANLILENVPQMPAGDFTSEAVRNSYLAEALFMRAYTYFYMIRIWGDPVLVTQSYHDIDYGNIPPLARTPEAVVLDSCIRDLKKAAGWMSFSGGDPAKTIRANKGSAYALLGHIYAWEHNYDSAHVYCRQVMDQGGYALESMGSYSNIWNGQSSSESIFELPMLYNSNDPNFVAEQDQNHPWAEATFGFFGTFLKGPIVANYTSTCWISPSGGIVDQIFDAADARYNSVLTAVPASGGDKAGYMLLKYTNFKFQQPGTAANTGTLPYVNNDLVLLRLADIILLDAEALASKGDLAGAAADLKLTEDRAGISSYLNPTTQYDMLDEVVMERGRELIGEGQWYYDLIRTEPTQQWLEYVGYPADGRVNATNKGYYWPLDMGTLFPQDNLLVQNPYWATHK